MSGGDNPVVKEIKKIAWLGSAPGRVGGQSRVAFFTLKEFADRKFEVVAAGVGSQYLDAGEKSFCAFQPLDLQDTNGIMAWLAREQPDVLILSHDIWRFYGLPQIRHNFPNLCIVGWITIDAHPIHPSWCPLIRCLDLVLVPTQFGKEIIYKSFPEKSVFVVPYGVDKRFQPHEGGKAAARAALKDCGLKGLENKAVFCFAGVNQFKKNIGAMVDAFALQPRIQEAV